MAFWRLYWDQDKLFNEKKQESKILLDSLKFTLYRGLDFQVAAPHSKVATGANQVPACSRLHLGYTRDSNRKVADREEPEPYQNPNH
jgi:hypothetical protein